MPSLLPILSYDVPIQDGARSDLADPAPLLKGEHSSSASGSNSSSVLKKHPSALEEQLPEKKKKSKPPPPNLVSESVVVTDGAGASSEPQADGRPIAEAVTLMKTAVFAVQTALYNGLRSSVQLHAAAALLTLADYSDVVTERSNAKLCGYPLCLNPKPDKKARKGRFHISLSEHKVYDLEEMRQFCSTACAATSQTYGSALRVNHGDVLERQKLEDIVACVRGLNLGKMSASAQVGEKLVVHERTDDGRPPGEMELTGSPNSVEGYTPRTYVGSDGKPLKSAMKQSPRKHQRITWADETHKAEVDDTFSFVIDSRSFEEEFGEGGVRERLGIAQNVAEALTGAAEFVASLGEATVFSAGMSVVPPSDEQAEKVEQVKEISAASVAGDEEDEDASWFDDPPEDFRAEVSMFGQIWMALDSWVSTATLAHIYGREEAAEEFRSVNGRVVADVGGSSSAEILRTLCSCVSRVLPDVVQALGISVPLSVVEQAVGRLLGTMHFVQALPPLTTKHLRMISVLLLDALSVRLPVLSSVTNNRAHLQKFVRECGTSDADYESFKEILLPLGRLPSFSTMRGG